MPYPLTVSRNLGVQYLKVNTTPHPQSRTLPHIPSGASNLEKTGPSSPSQTPILSHPAIAKTVAGGRTYDVRHAPAAPSATDEETALQDCCKDAIERFMQDYGAELSRLAPKDPNHRRSFRACLLEPFSRFGRAISQLSKVLMELVFAELSERVPTGYGGRFSTFQLASPRRRPAKEAAGVGIQEKQHGEMTRQKMQRWFDGIFAQLHDCVAIKYERRFAAIDLADPQWQAAKQTTGDNEIQENQCVRKMRRQMLQWLESAKWNAMRRIGRRGKEVDVEKAERLVCCEKALCEECDDEEWYEYEDWVFP